MNRLFISDIHLGAPYFKKEDKLLALLKLDWDEIYIIGDLYELQGFLNKEQIEALYPEIFKILKEKNVTCLDGNHDAGSSGIQSFIIEIPQGPRIAMTHASQFEPSSNLQFVTKLNILFYKVFGFEIRRVLKKLKSYAALEKKAKEYYRDQCEVLIMGHTHTPKADGWLYYNCGDWVENTSWVEMHDKNIKLVKDY